MNLASALPIRCSLLESSYRSARYRPEELYLPARSYISLDTGRKFVKERDHFCWLVITGSNACCTRITYKMPPERRRLDTLEA